MLLLCSTVTSLCCCYCSKKKKKTHQFSLPSEMHMTTSSCRQKKNTATSTERASVTHHQYHSVTNTPLPKMFDSSNHIKHTIVCLLFIQVAIRSHPCHQPKNKNKNQTKFYDTLWQWNIVNTCLNSGKKYV